MPVNPPYRYLRNASRGKLTRNPQGWGLELKAAAGMLTEADVPEIDWRSTVCWHMGMKGFLS